ncbi:hypothetical protein KAFR_0E01670 [Kazachstania africana CBS 2517]|uniref:Sorting nexin-4 n=1 Tax=Kazachstania africana (strain ATCC 22294 / BCRC 22015 / CBS 2517 / CECT 1963 / NBRC 1671 / NRRL Y-8276) TaxID=1071382 RepID=H2AVC1_KAZAF|nr:hypothetical protein KAFR_0E01670 [Kazachstania africana CBS 2517]CCF58321.1 hypothetical protein KAFR_0E01670 [Kazachstania africana CBS 2517]
MAEVKAGIIKAGSSKEENLPIYKLEIIVSDPQKRTGDQGTSYVSYQISTKTDNPSYHKYNDDTKTIIVVHRRYSDLLLLHDILSNEYPTCIIPPLPDKKVFQYIAGDRFSQRFTQKRCHSLQNFLRRISLHPILSRSNILEIFLVSNEWDTYKKSFVANLPTNKEEVTDAFMNAFKAVNIQSEEFLEIKEKNDKLDHTISKLDSIYHKVVKKHDSISEDYAKLGTSIQDLTELVSGSNNDNLSKKLKVFNDGITQLSYGLNDLNKFLDFEYLVDLKDLEHYIESMRQLLKLKDQKQIDYEELSEYLTKSIKERDNLIAGYGSSNFLTNKLEELAGINQEAARREKINKLEIKITSLGTELEVAKKVADAFEQETLKEVSHFDGIKTKELKESLGNLADEHIKFFEKMLDTWTEVDKDLN